MTGFGRLPAWTWGVVGAVIVGFSLAINNLGGESLWIDEGATFRSISGSWGDLGQVYTDAEPNTILYYAVLKLATGVIGTSEVALRLPSAAFAAAAVPVVAAIAARVYGIRAALIAAGLLALNPFLVYFAQEARTYTLVVLLSSASTLLFMRALDRDANGSRWAAWVAVSVAAVWAHLFAGFVIAAQALSLAFHPRRPPLRTLIVASAAVVVLAAPVVIATLGRPLEPFSFIQPTTWRAVYGTLNALAGAGLLGWLLLAAAAAGLIAAFLNRRHAQEPDRPGTEHPESRNPNPWQLALLAGWVVVPFVLVILISELRSPSFLPRYMIVTLPGIVLLAAGGLARLRPWPLLAAVAVAVVALAIARISDLYDTRNKEDWRSAAGIVNAGVEPGDAIVISRLGHTNFDYYYRPDFPYEQAPILGPIERVTDFGAGRVWLVLFIGATIHDDTAEFLRLRSLLERGRDLTSASGVHKIRVELWAPGPA